MDLANIRKILLDYCQSRNYNFEFKEDEKKIVICGNLNFTDLGATGFCSFNYFKSGLALFNILFDDIDATNEVCQLLNVYNSNTFLLYATADECLTLEHTIYVLHEEDIFTYTDAIIEELSDEETIRNLKPILDLTK